MRLDAELLKRTGVFTVVSGEVAALVGGGYFLGKTLDQRLGTSPVLAAGLALIGFGVSCWRIWRRSKSWFAAEEKKD